MIAGRIQLCGRNFRVIMDTTALGRVAAAAAAGIDGPAGEAETRQLMRSVIDPRDAERWARTTAVAPPDSYLAACASAIAVITGRAARSVDPDDRQWAADMRAAIKKFQGGDHGQAFLDLAAQQAARWA